MKKLITFFCLFLIICLAIYVSWPKKAGAVKGLEITSLISPEETKTFESEVHRLALKYKQNEKLALKIMWCEGKHYTSSVNKNYRRVLIGKDGEGSNIYKKVHWSSDWGHWQINDYYHLKNALNMGLDIKNEWDNLEYGFWLLSKEGTRPWNASRYCWKSVLGVDT